MSFALGGQRRRCGYELEAQAQDFGCRFWDFLIECEVVEGKILDFRKVGVHWRVAEDAAGVQVCGQMRVRVKSVLGGDLFFVSSSSCVRVSSNFLSSYCVAFWISFFALEWSFL